MAAKDILFRRRNPTDTGWEEIVVSVTALSQLGFNALKEPSAGGTPPVQATPTVLATVGAGTYLAAALVSGIILRDPNGAGRVDTTDTRANILTAFNAIGQLTNDYDEAFVLIVNTADAAETITMAGGTNVTLQAAITIAQNSATKIRILRVSSTLLVVSEC